MLLDKTEDIEILRKIRKKELVPLLVTITHLSDKYERSIKEISAALSKWIESQDNKQYRKEYIIKGTHKEGYPQITIVNEDDLEKAKAALIRPYYFLYSVELSSSSPSLDLPKLSQVKVKNLLLPADILKTNNEHAEKPVQVGESSGSVPKQNELKSVKKPDNFFTQKTVEPDESKTQNNSKVETPPEKKNKNEVSPVDSKLADKISKTSSSKGNKGAITSFMNAKPNTTVKSETKNSGTKSSIAKFFNSKPNGVAKSEPKTNDFNKSTSPKDEFKAKMEDENSMSKTKEEKVKPPEKSSDSRKRSLEDSETKPVKSAKKFKAATTGRRRIVVDVDSSDEENVDIADDTPEHVSDMPVPDVPMPEVPAVEIKEDVKESKPLEPLTYQDEDGFLITVKDKKKPNSTPKKIKKPSPIKKTLQKLDKVPVKTAKKQGSITSFFAKK